MSKKKVNASTFVLYAAIAACAAGGFYLLFALSFINRVLPNTYLGPLKIGGNSEEDAA